MDRQSVRRFRDGLELPPGATVLVGENGSGTSTVLEVLAAALGLNAEGGSAGADRWAYFLRDE